MQKTCKDALRRSRKSVHRVVMSAAMLLWLNAAPAAAETIDTTAAWDGSSERDYWGVDCTATYGQTITTTHQTTLTIFSYSLQNLIGSSANCRAYVYAWDGGKATGQPLYSSGVMTIPNVFGWQTVTVNTGGVALAANQAYVVFLTTSNEPAGSPSAYFGWKSLPTSVYPGGGVVTLANGSNFGLLTTDAWSVENLDFAFIMNFGSAITATNAVTSVGNNNALGAAHVIDAHSALAACFGGVSSSAATYGQAVNQTLPLLTGNTVSIAQSTIGRVNGLIQTRQAEARGAAVPNNAFGAANSFMQSRQSPVRDLSYSNRFFNSVNSLAEAWQSKALGVSADGAGVGDKSFWVKTFGSWADQDDSGGIAGYSANTAGVVLGFDSPVSDKRRQGVAFSYARSEVNSNSAQAPQNADIDAYQLIGYGDTQLSKDVDFNYQIGIGQNSTKGHRTVGFLSGVADSSYRSPTFTAGMGMERTVKLNEQTRFSPSVRLDYSLIHDEAYQETGSAAINPLLLHVDGQTAQELVLGLDAKLSRQYNSSTNVSVNAGVGYDLLNERNSITSSYAGASDAVFVTKGLEKSPWLGRVGLGVIHNTKNGAEVNVRCDSDFRHGYINNSASVKLSWKF